MSELLDKHDRLRKYLGIDPLDIENVFISTPKILQQAGELAARAEWEKDTARYNVKLAEANAAARLREMPVNGKEPSQARIDSMLPLESEVKEAQEAFRMACYEANACEVLYEALKSQSMAMHKVADMVMAGFFNPTVMQDRRREEIRHARVQAERNGGRIVRPHSDFNRRSR